VRQQIVLVISTVLYRVTLLNWLVYKRNGTNTSISLMIRAV